ncbi:MarR family winged helix-turn-helix transcriptional regulator [Streptomyces sp. NPDC002917]|uniref:MarR family winged helix-turn-helix transcriptional regulator n=1 Tax=unclassified Streptomyces TaxID=2593676 RepID=UPI0036B98FB9|nr:MarR family transcriptional regulator [Streptomyces sp. NBC_01653]WTD37475.1 MarR family transcriptional regulator [Streptomyces sp. NBC_01643]WTD92868.1 MarR family transcriptional regulator [Streptomyces sp. NBC_01637]
MEEREERQEALAAHQLTADEQQQWYAFAYVLSQLPAALEGQMQRDAGIGHFEYMALSALSGSPERTLRMSDLAHYTGSTLSRLSNVVGRLEKRGWVRRRPDPADGRYTLATLTDAGQDTVAGAAPAHTDEVRRLVFDPLTKAQQRQLGTIAQRILHAMDAPCPTDWSSPDSPAAP